jgi:hypothetical protein
MEQTTQEVWKKAVSSSNQDYVLDIEVSTLGRIRKIPTGFIYKPQMRDGYLYIERSKKHIKVDHLVAETFIKPRGNDNTMILSSRIIHKDGNRLNNQLHNLKYYDGESDDADIESLRLRIAHLEKKLKDIQALLLSS